MDAVSEMAGETCRKRPDRLLAEVGITRPDQIDIYAIAKHCGATVVSEPLDGSTARLVGRGVHATITVSEVLPRARREFAIAHALGHWMHDHRGVTLGCSSEKMMCWSGSGAERRANRYAAELLMPKEMVLKEWSGHGIRFCLIDTLAALFRTSRTAMAIRLVELASHPAMVIYTERRHRKWCVKNRHVPGWARPKQNVHFFHKDVGSREIKGAEWFDAPEAREITVLEDSGSLLSTDLVLTVLSWGESDSQPT